MLRTLITFSISAQLGIVTDTQCELKNNIKTQGLFLPVKTYSGNQKDIDMFKEIQ